MVYPEKFESKIKFDKIRQFVQKNCLSDMGRDLVEAMKFSTEPTEIRERLEETQEFMSILEEEDQFPGDHFSDARPFLNKVRVEGLFLEVAEMVALKQSLESLTAIVRFFHGKDERYPRLTAQAGDIQLFPYILQRLDSIVSRHGSIKDTASPELGDIRHRLQRKQNGISRRMQALLQQAQTEGWAEKDTSIAIRDGRMVIPVPSAYKRKINGIVHDESATGKTSYIEPAEIVETNNEIRELELEEKREITRILRRFAEDLRPYVDDLIPAYDFLAYIDFVRAKAAFSLYIEATVPAFSERPEMFWYSARHPLLWLSLKNSDKNIVPLKIEIDETQRIILISGPNAGGKSVCLQTAGLLQYMFQCGLPVPVSEASRFGIFKKILIDMGDEQSIENDLSTYSSHLINMKNFLRYGDENTLILIDEFGTGTEPMLGGAIAEAILKTLNQKQVKGVITTHYQNLKHFAEDTEGIVNGAMLYDRHLMQPLFKLSIGNPGSSFAVEIARKIGLPEDVIADASANVGADYINMDKYLQDIVRDKRYWESKRQNIRQQEKKLEDVTSRYEQDLEAVNKQRKEIIREAKAEAQRILAEANAKIENTVREIKEAQAEKEQTKLARKALEEFKNSVMATEEEDDKITRKMAKLKERNERKKQKQKVTAQPIFNKEVIEVGDNVRLKGQVSAGTVMELQGKQAVVAFGMIKSTVKLEQLEKVSKGQIKREIQKSTFVSSQTTDNMHEKKINFKQEIDVRGMRGDEALQSVTYFIDDAIQVGAGKVRILHGTGTGILRQLIRDYLRTVPGVRRFQDEHVQFGGAGITVVEFD